MLFSDDGEGVTRHSTQLTAPMMGRQFQEHSCFMDFAGQQISPFLTIVRRSTTFLQTNCQIPLLLSAMGCERFFCSVDNLARSLDVKHTQQLQTHKPEARTPLPGNYSMPDMCMKSAAANAMSTPGSL